MGSAPFEDPRDKVRNALDHIALVERRFQEYANSRPPFDLQTTPQVSVLNFPKGELPKNIRLAAGDAIHNLRSALDIMAGDVVQASGKSRKGVHFPFAGTEGGLDEMIKKKHFDRATPEAIALLKSMKPYKGGNEALRALHDLDVTDKHNFIIPASERATFSGFVGGSRFENCDFGDSEIGILSVGGGPIRPLSVTPKLVFAPGQPLEGQSVIPRLHDLAKLALGIIEAFAKLFAGGSTPPGSIPSA